MNETIKLQLEHTSVRDFDSELVPDNVLETIIRAGQHGATGHFMQAYSIIKIEDNKIKKEFAKICKQEYIAKIPCLLIFVSDLYRNYKIGMEDGKDTESIGAFDRFMMSFSDTMIAAQNIVIASESLGYGTIYLGSISNDSKKVIDLLKLPKYTFPIIGLGIGEYKKKLSVKSDKSIINSDSIKPRLPLKSVFHIDNYRIDNNIHDELSEYDTIVEKYYEHRELNSKKQSFTSQISEGLGTRQGKRDELLKNLHDQGLILK